MKQRWEIMRFLAAERRQCRRKWIIFVSVMAILSYCAVLLCWTLQPQTTSNYYTPSQTIINNSEQSRTIITHPKLSQTTIKHYKPSQTIRNYAEPFRTSSTYQVYRTSSATPHVFGSASSASLTNSQHAQTISSNHEPSQTSINYSKLSLPTSSLAYAPSLARTFAASTEQTAMRKAGRRSGFVDDPDPQNPGDPLADDPFADDPDPLNPADPLATPVGDCPWILILLFVLFRFRVQHMLKRCLTYAVCKITNRDAQK